MRVCTGLARAEFALPSHLSPTSGATNGQGLLPILFGFHHFRMQHHSAQRMVNSDRSAARPGAHASMRLSYSFCFRLPGFLPVQGA